MKQPSLIKIHDKTFRIFLTEPELRKRIAEMGSSIKARFENKNPLFIVILNGAFMFASDLLKAVNIPCEIAFIRVSSYRGMESSGDLKESLDLQEDLRNRHVIVVEDIVDSGQTMAKLLDDFQAEQPASLSVASLLVKPEQMKTQVQIDFTGFEIPELFVVGYGLDYDGQGRYLKDIYQLKDD